MMSSKKEISELSKDSTDIYKRNMVNMYMIRPKDSIFEHLCYALSIKCYQLQPKTIENDSQLEVLDDKRFEANHSTNDSYPDMLILSSGERLHYRKVELVLQNHIPNKFKDPEGYAHHLLFMFYRFCDECELKVGQPSSYSSKLSKTGVIEVTNNNKSLVKPYSDFVYDAFLNYRSNISASWDPFSQQENDDVENELSEINEQTEISGQDIDNRNNQTYSEAVS